ncbi:glucokinase [Rhodobacteraceae bacterium CCMM004]|nr:glucokinase [Rhodobacteraceae bacterium CCMM004]
MTPAPNTQTLVADIGGTNTRVALAEGRTIREDTIQRFRNADHPGLESVLRRYLGDNGDPDCIGACVAVAGPVNDGRGTLTNLDWTIDRDTLARAAQAEKVAILNDLQAQGHALGHIAESNLKTVIAGTVPLSPNPTRLVIGVGTGFNAAPVYDLPAGRAVTPSEAGHANMPIRTEADLRLCKFVETAHGFPAVEDVLSGRGLVRIHRWISHEAGAPTELSGADIIAAIDDDAVAAQAVATFIRILGTEAGNLALIHLPFGGIYLAGGMARAVAPFFSRFGFEAAFRDKGRFSGFMQGFSVSVIEDDYAALTGCACALDAM